MCRKFLLIFSVLVLGLATNAWAQDPASQDIGNPAIAGGVTTDGVTWNITGAGADIWGSWDQFHFVFRPLAGDGSGIVRVVSTDCTYGWAKYGVMIRETLDGDSKHAAIAMTPEHGAQSLWRQETGGGSASAELAGVALPLYLKIERMGDVIMTSTTWDLAFWIPQQTLTIPMNENVYIGMFVGSVSADTPCTAVFDSVDLTAPPYLSAWAVSPADGLLVTDLEAGVTISWMPGDTAASHNVHLGTTSPPDLAVNQTETTYNTGPLEGGQTYYWRIDEVEADGTTIHAGEERSFKTMRAGTGAILREVWEGIGGVVVSDLTNNANYPANPSYSDTRTLFEAPIDFADNFGSRLHGWLHPETSGDYTFWISSDDASDLLLSTSDSPLDAEIIANVPGWTSSRQWDSYAEQQSAPVTLEGGQTYYISAIYKEGGGGDNCAVAWEGPDSPTMSVIDGYFLSPFVNLWAWGPNPADGATGVGMTPTLSWSPAVDAVSYDVYVDGALLGNTAETSMPAGPFDLSEYRRPSTHTWRVDTVTDAEVRAGATWSFTVANYRVIDDFDAYDAVPEGTAPQMVVGGDYTIEAVAPPEQTVIGGDITIEAVAPPEQEVISGDVNVPALWGYYPLNGDTLDASGNGRDGTGVPGTYIDGKDGQAMEFTPDGWDDYVSPGTGNPSADTGQLSLSLWLKWNGVSGQWQGLIGKRDTWNANEMMWQIEGNVDTGDISVSREAGSGIGGYGIPVIGEWEHCAFTTDGSTGTLYRDGAEVGSGAFTYGFDPEALVVFGCCESTGGNPFNGALDEVRIYSSVLSADQVAELAALGDPAVDPVYVPPIYGPLVAHYKLDGDLTDSSGNGVDGTAMGGDPVYAAGMVDQALDLDGGDDFIDFGKPSVWPTGTSARSVSAWAKTDTVAGGWAWALAYGNAGTGTAMFLGRNADTYVVGGYGDDMFLPTFWEPDVWHHMCLTYDGATARMYADGIEVRSAAKNWNCIMSRAHIGRQVNDAAEFWDGPVDDVRIYNIALSPGEVAYLAGGDVVVPPVYGPCRLSLEFEGDLTDSSGNNNHGTAYGAIGFETDPVRGQVVSLPGGDNQFVEVGNVGLSGNDPTTIACWAKADHTSIPDWTLIFGFTGTDTRGGGNGSHFNIGSLGGPGGCGAHVWGWEERMFSDDEALEWHHYAMTYDGTTIAYYGDGVPMDTDPGKSNVQDLSIRGDRVHVGSRVTQASSFPGKVDDARVYDYALSENEILHISGIGDRYIPPVYGPMALHLELDGDATDSSGNGNDGTLMGGATIADGVLSLNGAVDDYVDVPHDASLTMDDEVTVAAWINAERHNAAGGDWQAILAKGNSPRSYSFYTYTNGTLHFSTAGVGSNSATTVPLNEWVHVAAMVVDGRHRYYINGAFAGEGGAGINLPGLADTASVRIGRTNEGGNNGFLGQIDDVRIYDYALTSGQVADLAGRAAENPVTDTWSEWGLVDLFLESNAMRINTYGVPGLPYYVGEASRTVPFTDLTVGGAKALDMWFSGDPANSASVMYAALTDGDGASDTVLYSGDLATTEWQVWHIDMRDFEGVDESNASEIAVGLAGLDGGALGDVMLIDDIRVYTGRCMPDLAKPTYDLNDDCVVDIADLEILIGEWGRQILTQDYEERAAYWDERYPFNWGGDGIAVRDALAAVGYTVLDADQLKTWMDDRIADGKLSVVVMCRDSAPDTVAENNDANCTLRRYLDAGGKVVWFSDIPFYYQGHSDGTQTTWGEDGQAGILGLGNLAQWDSGNTVTITDAGAAWGLTGTWSSLRAEHASDVDVVLATDNSGNAAAYVKYYAPGGAGQGFVRLWDQNTAPLVADVISAAEAKGVLTADLNGDGTVGWADVFTMLDEWLDEVLWPY